MPLIDRQMIESLKRPDGSFSQFSLYLLNAVPRGHLDEPLPKPEPDWQERVLCTKISKAWLRCIKGEARRIARMKQL